MFCTKCGEPASGRFCAHCGEATQAPPVNDAEQAARAVPKTPDSVSPGAASPRADPRSVILKAVGVALVVAMTVFVVIVVAALIGTRARQREAASAWAGNHRTSPSSGDSQTSANSPSTPTGDCMESNTQCYASYVAQKGQTSCYEAVHTRVASDLEAGAALNATFNGPSQTAGTDMDHYMVSLKYDDALPDAAAKFRQNLAQRDVSDHFAGQSAQQITESWNLDNIATKACTQTGYRGPGDLAP